MQEIILGGGHICHFDDVISVENLLKAWREFSKGKRSKQDVIRFELKLEENLFDLHRFLKEENWKPDPYQIFFVRDPKLREIHKASVRDRVLYQAIYRILYPIFDSSFIFHSYSSRKEKGTHLGVKNFSKFSRKISKNWKIVGYSLKCDIRKFFDSINHEILLNLIRKKVSDEKLLKLLEKIIFSFEKTASRGLPLGNVTSQLFSNIYLNELDQFVKKSLKARYYLRYCDDFVILNQSADELKFCLEKVRAFCIENLLLELHPRKIEIRKLHLGIDFLGYVSLSNYTILRTRTKNRMLGRLSDLKIDFKNGKIEENKIKSVVSSYLGLLKHCNSYKIRKEIRDDFNLH